MAKKTKAPIVIFSALADATRCKIIEILLDGPVPVHELADRFTISRPAISRHLRVLRTAGLVKEVKKGRENFYALQRSRVAPANRWLLGVLPGGNAETHEAELHSETSDVLEVTAPEFSGLSEAIALNDAAATAAATKATDTPSTEAEPAQLPEPPHVPSVAEELPAAEAKPRKLKPKAKPEPLPSLDQMGFDF